MLSPKRISPDTGARDVDCLQVPLSVSPTDAMDEALISKLSIAASDKNEDDNDDDFVGYRPGKDGVSLAQKMHDEFLICKICLEDFKNPKCLDCMHTFCEECIENHVFSESSYKKYSDYRDFTCPLCRKRSSMPLGGVRKLPDNLIIRGLQELVAKKRPLAVVLHHAYCDICRCLITSARAGRAPARCLDCNKSLCSACVDAHRQTTVTSRHSLYDPQVVSSVLQDPDGLGCSDHRDETVGYYCVDCDRCVCILCVLDTGTEGRPHFGHEIVDITTAVNRYESQLSALCSRATAEAARLEAELGALASCSDNIDAVRQRIKATTAAFRRQIDADERALLDRLDTIYGPDCRQLLDARPTVKERVERLGAVRRRAETVLEHRGVELLLLKKVIRQELETEEQRMQDDADGATPLPKTVAKRVEFVPGSVDFGCLREVEGGARIGPERAIPPCGDPGCRCQCHEEGAAALAAASKRSPSVEESTMTEQKASPVLVDKGVNTKARGLLHNGGSGGKRAGAAGTQPPQQQQLIQGAEGADGHQVSQ